MVTSWLTWSGASVGVSISTQRRIPSRMAVESKGFEEVVVSMLSPSQEFNHRYSPTRNCTSAEASSAYQCSVGDSRWRKPGTLLAQRLSWIQGSLAQRRLSQGAAILSQFWHAQTGRLPPRRMATHFSVCPVLRAQRSVPPSRQCCAEAWHR